ncbi:MAG: flagellar hook assembly protein FlgD [Firmicutes bacterium]|nr:flagellar hook assembly protein FlgD [Bacillota bacterium]
MAEVSAVGSAGSSSYAGSSKQKNSGMELGTDTFLKLLITQMRYQDPFSGGQDMGEFMNQVAQFTMLERLLQLQQTMEASAQQQNYTQALNLLNKNVEINDNGFIVQGEVTAVRFVGGSPRVCVNGAEYTLDMITMIE